MSTSLKDIALCDLEREFAVTRRVLERIPQEHFAFKPHAKSMDFGRLAMHVATLPQWMLDTIIQDELDMLTVKGPPTEPISSENLLCTFDQISTAVKEALAKMDDAALSRTWTMRQGPQVLYTNSKAFVLRVWCVNHMVHHRAQLCVYLRLLNLPVPAVYFNSSDEPEWKFE